MGSRTRLIVLFATVPVVAFTMVGGFLGQAVAREDTYRHLRIFEDVVSLISGNYVEEVDLEGVMHGALKGLAGGLDTDSAFLSVEDVARIEAGTPLPAGALGVEITSQYYIRVIAAQDGSPSARAGVIPGDYIRAIDGQTTRLVSAVEGERLLRGEPGSTVHLSLLRGNTQEPYDVELTRERLIAPGLSSRMLDAEIGYIRVPAFTTGTSDELSSTFARLVDRGAATVLLDMRNNAGGSFEEGVASARLFVGSGTLLRRAEHGDQEILIEATAGITAIDTPLVLLTNPGTAHAAELFVAAVSGAGRADTVGLRTAGRTSLQKLVKLPDGTGLWLSWARYVNGSGDPIHRLGVRPTVEVDVPFVELGEPTPTEDLILERAIEHARAS